MSVILDYPRPDSVVPYVLDDHFPWGYTEFGTECACGAAVVGPLDECSVLRNRQRAQRSMQSACRGDR